MVDFCCMFLERALDMKYYFRFVVYMQCYVSLVCFTGLGFVLVFFVVAQGFVFEFKIFSDQYMKDEFRRYKIVGFEEVQCFLQEWEVYVVVLW